MKYTCLTLTLFLAACATHTSDRTSDRYVVTSGTGPTQKEAVDSALHAAVELAVGAFVVGKQELIDEVVRENIISYSSGFVSKHTILHVRESESGTLWSAMIGAWVQQKELIAAVDRAVPGSVIRFDGSGTQWRASAITKNRANQQAAKMIAEILSGMDLSLFLVELGGKPVPIEPDKRRGELPLDDHVWLSATVKVSLDTKTYQDRVIGPLRRVLKQCARAFKEPLSLKDIFSRREYTKVWEGKSALFSADPWWFEDPNRNVLMLVERERPHSDWLLHSDLYVYDLADSFFTTISDAAFPKGKDQIAVDIAAVDKDGNRIVGTIAPVVSQKNSWSDTYEGTLLHVGGGGSDVWGNSDVGHGLRDGGGQKYIAVIGVNTMLFRHPLRSSAWPEIRLAPSWSYEWRFRMPVEALPRLHEMTVKPCFAVAR